jgi:hypothetical protein
LAQTPAWHVLFPLQTLPQVPQLLESVWRSVQTPGVQAKKPAAHWHCRLTQSSVAASQAWSQDPQCSGFCVMSSQPLPQSRVPLGHAHVPPEHWVPPVQTVVQSPQCCSSERVLNVDFACAA